MLIVAHIPCISTKHLCFAALMATHYGDNNSGVMLRDNSGQIHVHLPRELAHRSRTVSNTKGDLTLERPEPLPSPLSTVPFPRDPDYVHRGLLFDDIHRKLSTPAARVVLTGLGGVGYGANECRFLAVADSTAESHK